MTKTYSYDLRGNITNIKEYVYTTAQTITGTPLKEKVLNYDNTWKDQLGAVQFYENGSYKNTYIFNYDNSGNPIKLFDMMNGVTSFTWEGRQLVSVDMPVGVSYKYNDQGIRTQKNYRGNVTDYYVEGDKVIYEKSTYNQIIYYTYDVDGTLLSMNLNGNEYFYITSLQGDIIELVDIDGNTVVKYKYDAWGNIEYQFDNSGVGLAEKNPYRYRGYRFDEETGYYYLNSRYYNPEIGRFINADGLSGQQGDILGHNMYAYCQNNPVMMVDPNGQLAWLIGGAIVGAVAGGIYSYSTTGSVDWRYVAGGALAGACLGGLVEVGIAFYSSSGTALVGSETVGGSLTLGSEGTDLLQQAAQSQQSINMNVDSWELAYLEAGDLVCGMLPGQGAYYTDTEFLDLGLNNVELYNALQIAENPNFPMRDSIGIYLVIDRVQVATSYTANNTAFGSGGLRQYYIPNAKEVLERLVEFLID